MTGFQSARIFCVVAVTKCDIIRVFFFPLYFQLIEECSVYSFYYARARTILNKFTSLVAKKKKTSIL